MQVSNVTNADGQQMANVINFLKAGRWDLSGKDADAFVEMKRWVASVATEMAKQLTPAKATPAAAPAATPAPAIGPSGPAMKIKGMGPIGGGSGPRSSAKKKK